MATLYVTEFHGIGSGSQEPVQCAAMPKLTTNNVAITGATVQSAPFVAAGQHINGASPSLSTTLIRVHADAVCSVEIGGINPVATATSQRMAANQTEYFRVKGGDRLAVISNT